MFITGISGIIPGTNSTAVGAPGGTDPYWNNVVLMLGMEGADGSTSFVDESPAANGAATVNGQAQVDTAQFKFGGSSLILDGSDEYLNYADHDNWNLGSGDFTIETWVRFNALTGFRTFVSQWHTSAQLSWLFDFTDLTFNRLRFGYSTTGSNTVTISGAWTPSTGVWYHVAASRSGNTLKLFADGAEVGSGDLTGVTIFDSTSLLRIGAVLSGGIDNELDGWLDEMRITKGVGRYTGAFTAPTAAFPRA